VIRCWLSRCADADALLFGERTKFLLCGVGVAHGRVLSPMKSTGSSSGRSSSSVRPAAAFIRMGRRDQSWRYDRFGGGPMPSMIEPKELLEDLVIGESPR
jgi:hypothetical protein